jgi:hypothetical protein
MGDGIGGEGGCGSPGAPQPSSTKTEKRTGRAHCVNLTIAKERGPFLFSIFVFLYYRM